MKNRAGYIEVVLAAAVAAALTGLIMQSMMERDRARLLHEMGTIARQAASEASHRDDCWSGYAGGQDSDCRPDPEDLPDSNLPSPI